jgi:hypothetical protein
MYTLLKTCLVIISLKLALFVDGPMLPDGTYGKIVGNGIQCTPYGESKPSGPLNYSTNDLGKKGVPKLTQSELAMIRRIKKYIHKSDLRFAFVNGVGRSATFIIYEADRGLCFDGAPGFLVLNLSCQITYEPGERPEFTGLMPDCRDAPRPWMQATP